MSKRGCAAGERAAKAGRARKPACAVLVAFALLGVVGSALADSRVERRSEPERLSDDSRRPHLPHCGRHRSRSIGSPGHGGLARGVLFPSTGPDHFAWNFRAQRIGGSHRTRWGHCRVVRAVLLALAAYRARNPGAPPVAVGDMGLRHGGEIDRHSTHENGRQIDLYFPRRDRRLCEPRSVAQVDLRLSRELVRAILAAGADRVLIGPRLRIAAPARVLRWPNHDDHLHAMF